MCGGFWELKFCCLFLFFFTGNFVVYDSFNFVESTLPRTSFFATCFIRALLVSSLILYFVKFNLDFVLSSLNSFFTKKHETVFYLTFTRRSGENTVFYNTSLLKLSEIKIIPRVLKIIFLMKTSKYYSKFSECILKFLCASISTMENFGKYIVIPYTLCIKLT